MNFLREFIKEVLRILEDKILANPVSFLGVTGFFIVILYFNWLENRWESWTIHDFTIFGIFYIISLSLFMDKKASNPRKSGNKIEDKMEIKQNNISLISIFKNIKK